MKMGQLRVCDTFRSYIKFYKDNTVQEDDLADNIRIVRNYWKQITIFVQTHLYSIKSCKKSVNL